MDALADDVLVNDALANDALANDALLRADTLTDKAYRALEEEIVTLRIAPGTVVSEAMLSRRLGVGRTPVREALQRLAREWLGGILPPRGGGGVGVRPGRAARPL